MDDAQQLRDSIRSHAQRVLRNGFLTSEDIERDLREYADDDITDYDLELEDDALHQLASEELAAARKAHHAEMASWPKVTDCDRLDAAFTELNAMGIMARHNWTCCSTCGNSQMSDELRRLKGRVNNTPIIGHVFYHEQDTERAAEGGGLYLGFGSTLKAGSDAEFEQRSVAIARTACDVLAKHGLKTIWDGTFDHRPLIKLDWKRRGVPKDYVDSNGACNGGRANAPIDIIEPVAAGATPEVAARPMRAVDKLASYAITAISVLAAIAVVIAVAFIGVPIGDWVIHSVWLAVVLGVVTLALVAGVLTLLAKFLGLKVEPFGPDTKANTKANT